MRSATANMLTYRLLWSISSLPVYIPALTFITLPKVFSSGKSLAVVYVWLDALTNYITGIGYDCDGNSSEQFKKDWPAVCFSVQAMIFLENKSARFSIAQSGFQA